MTKAHKGLSFKCVQFSDAKEQSSRFRFIDLDDTIVRLQGIRFPCSCAIAHATASHTSLTILRGSGDGLVPLT